MPDPGDSCFYNAILRPIEVLPAFSASDSTCSATSFRTPGAACDSFTLYDEMLRATNGDASSSAVMRALSTVGRSYVSASTVEGRVAMTDDGRVAAAAGRLFAFVADKGFQYTSGSFQL